MSKPRPTLLSVVVPSVNGWGDLSGCLAALDIERHDCSIEVIVPERCGAEVQNSISERYPWVRVIPVASGTTIPQMRAYAFAVASSPGVAVIEDHIQVPPGWAGKMVSALTNGHRVVGGGLVNGATEHIVDWAAFYCEYSQLVAPGETGPTTRLTGNNTAYDRELLVEFRDTVEAGRWEDFLHTAFRRRGIVLWNRPDITVRHKKHYTVPEYLSQRFLYARAFAGMRMDQAGPLRRFTVGALTVVLPPVLLWRIISRVWRSKPHRGSLVKSLPLLALFVSVWGLGEAVGSWFGKGNALARVR